MGRKMMTSEEVTNKFQDIKELLDELKQQRAMAQTDAEKNEYTKKISTMKRNLTSFKQRYLNRMPPTVRNETKQPKQNLISKQPLQEKLQEIRNKAQLLIKQAKTEAEVNSIKERLSAVELRYKYSFI